LEDEMPNGEHGLIRNLDRGRLRARASALIVGLTLAPAALAYGAGTGTARPRPHEPVAAHAAKLSEKLTKTQKLRKALAACKKADSKAKRERCETQAKRLYGDKRTKHAAKPGETTAGTRGAGATGGEMTAGAGAAGGNEGEELQKAATVGAPTAAGVEAGKKLFAEQCAGCHGTTGTGGDGGPNLNEMPRAHSVTGVIEQLITPVGPMPSFEKGLSFQEKEELANFVTVEITHAAGL
jgi:mono/diheme cytochrome c family protein